MSEPATVEISFKHYQPVELLGGSVLPRPSDPGGMLGVALRGQGREPDRGQGLSHLEPGEPDPLAALATP